MALFVAVPTFVAHPSAVQRNTGDRRTAAYSRRASHALRLFMNLPAAAHLHKDIALLSKPHTTKTELSYYLYDCRFVVNRNTRPTPKNIQSIQKIQSCKVGPVIQKHRNTIHRRIFNHYTRVRSDQ